MSKHALGWAVAVAMTLVVGACTMPAPGPTSSTSTTTTTSSPSTSTTSTSTTTTSTTTTSTTTTTTVPVNQVPVASFTATPPKGEFPLPVAFDAGASSDSDGTIVDYAWTFGDGTSANGVTAAHTYAAIGTYTATLFVTDDDGAIGSTTRTVKVTRVTTSISPEAGAAGSTIAVSVPCAPLDGWVAGAAAMASLVDGNSNVLDTVTVENTDVNQARVALTLTVPAGAAAGTYSVTSSCDTYLGSDVFDPVDFTVS